MSQHPAGGSENQGLDHQLTASSDVPCGVAGDEVCSSAGIQLPARGAHAGGPPQRPGERALWPGHL